MKFGPLAVGDAVGAISAHSLRLGQVSLRKGDAITPEMAHALAAEGLPSVVAARLEPDDVGEDPAALTLAQEAAGAKIRVDPPFTGRANLFATTAGLLVLDVAAIDRANAVDESVTLATLPAFRPVVPGEMVATVKIIPYAVPRLVLAEAVSALGHGRAVAVAPYRLRRIAAVSTLAPGLKPSVVTKTVEVLRRRLAPTGADLVSSTSVPHDRDALAEELRLWAAGDAELAIVFGASAIADRRDVIPAAIEAAGGRIEHFGMPVDPGNLMLVATLAGRPVIGAPGCARSPKENGFDWILGRLLAGLPVTREVITRLGVGGLLMEIVTRGQPRAGGERRDEDEG